jgi:hypothetical protein
MAVGHREAAGTACTGTIEDFETLEVPNLEILDIRCVGDISNLDTLTDFSLRRCLNL